jgi:hypothetical protein
MDTSDFSCLPSEQCKWLSVIDTSPAKNGVYIIQFPRPPFTGVCLWDTEDWWLLDVSLMPGFTIEITHWSILPCHWQDHAALVSSVTFPNSSVHNSRLARPIWEDTDRTFPPSSDNPWHKEGDQLPSSDGLYMRTVWSGISPVLWDEGQWSTLNSSQETLGKKPGAHWTYLPSTLEEYDLLIAAAKTLDRPPPGQHMWEMI